MGSPVRVGVVAASLLLHEGLVRVLSDDPTLAVWPDMIGWNALAVPNGFPTADLIIILFPERLPPSVWREISSLCISTKVVVLLHQRDQDTTRRALQLGVTGILTIDTDRGNLVKAIHEVAAGGLWCEPVPAVQDQPDVAPRPSNRERDVLLLIRRGLSNRDIADRLCISERTVKSHVNRLLHKFHVKNRVQLVLSSDERLDWITRSPQSPQLVDPK